MTTQTKNFILADLKHSYPRLKLSHIAFVELTGYIAVFYQGKLLKTY